MPHAHHHHHRNVHLHARDDIWDHFTSAAASVWNDAFPTANNNAASDSKTTDSGNGNAADGPATIYRTVYTTQTPSGWTGTALSTLAPAVDSPTATPTPTPTTTDDDTLQTEASSTSADADPTTTSSSSTELPAVISPSSSQPTVPPTLVVASTTQAPTTFSAPSSTLATSASAASATSGAKVASSTDGPSAGAKAGIAIGVLAGILVVFLALYFLFTRRKKQMDEQRRVVDDDEKRNGPFADSHAIAPGTTPSTTSSARAPRLSLRPVTQFLPNLVGGNGNNQTGAAAPGAHPDRRTSRGAAIAMTTTPTAAQAQNLPANNRALGPAGNAQNWNPPSIVNGAPANPFGTGAERIYSPIPEESSRAATPTSQMESEIGSAITTNSPPRSSSPATAAMAAGDGAAAGAAVGVGLARKTSMRKDNAPRPLDLTRPQMNLSAVPPSPAGTEFSINSVGPGQSPGPSTSAAAIAAAGGPAQSAVHRVQLDFKPTMEDEMELRAGQLVRLLHEYDDGWALCIRLDRSVQGVVPRTCLSTRPVKPRPAPGAGPGRPGPPINPNRGPGPGYGPPSNRGPPPQGQGAPYDNNGGGNAPYPRPGSAQSNGGRRSPYGGGGGRSQSPGPRYHPQQGQRQGQDGMQQQQQQGRRMSPPSQSQNPRGMSQGPVVGRKPVPGAQAQAQAQAS